MHAEGFFMPNNHDCANAGLLTKEAISRFLTGGEIGSRLEIHDEIASTNTRAKELAVQGARHGTVVMARRQSAGCAGPG